MLKLTHILILLRTPNLFKTDKKQANTICTHLSNVFKPYNDVDNNLLVADIENSLNSPRPLFLAPKSPLVKSNTTLNPSS